MSAADGKRQAEPRAKVALIEYLRKVGDLRRSCAMTSELVVNKNASRADLVVISDHVHCYEVKTERDTLSRLGKQVEEYSLHADYVSVLLASNHLDAAVSRLPKHVGVLELREAGGQVQVQKIRDAGASALTDPFAMLSFLPVNEIIERLLPACKLRRRHQVLEGAVLLDADVVKRSVVSFLLDRYQATTQDFLTKTRRRSIAIEDLQKLRVWKSNQSSTDGEGGGSVNGQSWDIETYIHVGRSFGPVPSDIREMMAC